MKIAIVHDELIRRGGAERVVLCFHKAFPDAPIYVSTYKQESTYPYFKSCDVRTSWYDKLVKTEKDLKRYFYPIGIWAMKSLDVTDYDVVLMSSTYWAKYVKVSDKTVVINYCHTPFRLAWFPESYTSYLNANPLKKVVFDLLISRLKKIDSHFAKRSDFYITNAQRIKERIQDIYKPTKEIAVINPPVNNNDYYFDDKAKKDYYLVVSRLEDYKSVDLVIEAFNELGLPLVIIGNGSQKNELENLANDNVTFLSGLSNQELAKYYANSKALIFPQDEDYGITPLESIASGNPVIAYGKGGILETMIPYDGTNADSCTAVLFDSQSKEDLINAVKLADQIEFDPCFIRNHANKFNEEQFILAIQNFVSQKYEDSKA